jgi:acetyltransferase-like isoleucine patch superfamily enzyme
VQAELSELAAAARRTPWKARNEIRRILWAPCLRARFAWHGIAWGAGWRIYGAPLIQRHRGSRIVIGDRFEMRNWRSSNPLGVAHPGILATWSAAAAIVIGDDVGMTGVTVCAESGITIGNRVLIGANAVIADTDFHPLHPVERRMAPGHGATLPIEIADDCFLGMHVLVLKGARIGRGAVVGAGSVVTGDVPPGAIVAGNPARPIGVVDDPSR